MGMGPTSRLTSIISATYIHRWHLLPVDFFQNDQCHWRLRPKRNPRICNNLKLKLRVGNSSAVPRRYICLLPRTFSGGLSGTRLICQMKHNPPSSGVLPVSDLLVADPDQQSLELCCEAATAAGLALRNTHDSETTLDVLESGLVDFLLLSEQLPGGSDLELLRHIQYWYPETQVIMISEHPSYASAVQATKLGAFDCLPKPLDGKLLEATIERAMEASPHISCCTQGTNRC